MRKRKNMDTKTVVANQAAKQRMKERMKKISIVIPCYNQEENVSACLDSIFSQEFDDFEVVVVDDKSTDKTLEILEEYQQKHENLILIRFDENRGTSQARKVAALRTTGKYVMFVDPDDQLENEALQKAYSAIESEQVDILQFGTKVVGHDVSVQDLEWVKDRHFPYRGKLFGKDIFFCCFKDYKFSWNLWNKIYDGELIRKSFSFILDAYLITAEDLYAFAVISMLAKSYASIEDKLYIYNRGDGISKSTISFEKIKKIIPEIKISEYLFKFLDSQNMDEVSEYISVLVNIENKGNRFHDRFYTEIFSNYLKRFENFKLYENEIYLEFLENALPKCKREDFSNPNIYDAFSNFIYATIDRFVFEFKCDLLANTWIQQKLKNNEISDFPKTSRLLSRNAKYLDFQRSSKKIVPVVFATNEKYAPYLSVAIESLVENASADNLYDIYILHTKLSRNTQHLLEQTSAENVLISSVNVSQKFKEFGSLYSYGQFSEEMYFRFSIAEILKEYKKVVYLDCDIVVLEDIANFFSCEIGDNILGVVPDMLNPNGAAYVSSLGVPPEKYFNSGVLLINTAEFAKHNIEKQFASSVNELRHFRFPDQDFLNILCKNKVAFLNQCWNCQLTNYRKNSTEIYQLSPKIVHYSGSLKPWNSTEVAFSEFFWKYARKTVFYETIFGNYLLSTKKFGIQQTQTAKKKQHGKFYRCVSWPFRMSKKFFVSLKKEGLKKTLKKVRNKQKTIFNKLLKKNNKTVVSCISNPQINLLKFETMRMSENQMSLTFSLSFVEASDKFEKVRLNLGKESADCKPVGKQQNKIKYDKKLVFEANIPLKEDNIQIEALLIFSHKQVPVETLFYGRFFSTDRVFQQQYFAENGWMVRAFKDKLCITKVSKKQEKKQEKKYLSELRKEKLYKTMLLRKIYNTLKPKFRKPIWLITDNFLYDDNGSAFFEYLVKSKNKEVKYFFAMNRASDKYHKMKKQSRKRVLSFKSLKYKILTLVADVKLSSVESMSFMRPYKCLEHSGRDIYAKQKFVFLQHGVITNDMSVEHNKLIYNTALFVVTSRLEQQEIQRDEYYYDKEQIILTGLARFDKLTNDPQKIITIMPTWRKYVLYKNGTNTVVSNKEFCESDYFKFYNTLLNDERLHMAATKYGYEIAFKIHPMFIRFNGCFDNKKNYFRLTTESYREVYSKSSLVLTDYSSAIFDFLYLGKPIIYTHFDRDEFYSGAHVYTEGFIDHENDGFGECEFTLDSTVDRLIEYMKNGCKMKPKFEKKVGEFFEFIDKDNCKRIYDEVLRSTRKIQ